ncbi:hypothetical protein KIW84_044251 [Lathyrus oleraceus]|uniref:Uncharacterized protein n=1 Tax=Pisum sativum TaxID=3888 RepID=A0A9D4XJT3_PEA|nr:hypothetical protein KIW84_044251 [Pisum sativum]
MFPSGKGNQDLDNGNVVMKDDNTSVENGKTEDGVEALENPVTSESADEVSAFPLEHCMRILPNDQNTGAFFIVVLQKVSPLPTVTEKPSKQIDEQNVEPPNQSLKNTQTPLINSSDSTIEEVVKEIPEENMIDNVSNTEDLEVSPLTHEEQNSEETKLPHNAQDTVKKVAGKRKLQIQGQWRERKMATVADIGYYAAINLRSAIIFLLAFAMLRPHPFPPVASKHAKKLPLNAVTSINDGLKKLYVDWLKPLKATDRFNDFVSPLLTNINFDAKPMVMLLGQYSTGKISIALHFSPFVESYQTVTRSHVGAGLIHDQTMLCSMIMIICMRHMSAERSRSLQRSVTPRRSYRDATENGFEGEVSKQPFKKPKIDVRRIIVQDAISLFEINKHVENSVQACLLKIDVTNYDPLLHERGFHKKLNVLVKESLQLGRLPLPGVHHYAALLATLAEYNMHLGESELQTLTVDGLKKEILSLIEHEVGSDKVSIVHCWKCFFARYFHNWCKNNALYGLLVDSSTVVVGLVRKKSVSLFRSLEYIERIVEGSLEEVSELTGIVDLFDDDIECEILIELLKCVTSFNQQLGKSASSIFYESLLIAPMISSEDIVHCIVKVLETGYCISGAVLRRSTSGDHTIFLQKELTDHRSLRKLSVDMFLSLQGPYKKLAPAVTEDVCSLRSDVERLAFYVIWEMTPEADIISTRYVKSVIKSATTLSYVEAQARMDDSRLMDPVTTDLRNMNSLASDAVRFKTAHVRYVVAVCDALQLVSFSSPSVAVAA